MKKFISAALLSLLMILSGCSTSEEKISDEQISETQKLAEEYILSVVHSASSGKPRDITVVKAGYNSKNNEDDLFIKATKGDGLFYFTIEEDFEGQIFTDDVLVVYGGEDDTKVHGNNSAGNDYDSLEELLDVDRLNAAVEADK